MNTKVLKKLIYITVLILIIIISYKVYLSFHESNFTNNNYENIKIIQSNGGKDLYSFAVLGSIENSIDVFQNKIIHNINSDKDIAFTASTGYAVLDGAEDKYQILSNALRKLDKPSIMGIGNAEISNGGAIRFYNHFGPYYFSFVYGDSYFIFIDTTGTTAFDLQEEWISNELSRADKFNHKFIFMDKSPIKANQIKSENFRNFLTDIFSKHDGVSVFTNGSFFKKDVVKGVPYYSSGGAGGLMLNSPSNSDYHYLKVDVTANGVAVKPIKVLCVSHHVIIQKIESIWIFIHSIIYVHFINIALVLFLILFVFLILYAKVSKDVNYYRNFGSTDESINIDGKLNIAMFTNNYFPFIGGVPISIKRLADTLRKRGNNVVIFAPEYPQENDIKDDAFRCKLLDYKKTDNFNFAIANIYSYKINKEFIRNNFDIVHVHHPFWMGKKGLKLGKNNNIPVVLTYHTRLEMYYENLPIFKLAFKNIFSHRMIKKFAQKCDGIIAPTTSAKEYLENVGVSREKIVLPTGIDLEKYKAIDENTIKIIRNSYVSDGQALLCSVSRLSPEKNIDFLIKGLKHLKENTTVNFKCIIIGDGPERENLQKLIDNYSLNNEISLIGLVKQDEISTYYLASDLFVFSSLSETQGMVLLEAMAGKCPVVTVRSSGTDDVVCDKYNGFKTSEDIIEWAEKIKYLIENRDILEKMSLNALEYAKNFSLDKMAEKVEVFYKKLIIQNKTKEN